MKDVPHTSEKLKDHKQSLEEKVTSDRDEKYSKYVEQYNKKRRNESLVEMHQKKKVNFSVLIIKYRCIMNKFDTILYTQVFHKL